MNTILTVILAVQILAALGMIGLILVQHGKGADMGAAFGSGASGSLFGATGSANFLSRTTGILAIVFFISTLALAYFGSGTHTVAPSGSVLDRPAVQVPAPAAPSSAPAGDASVNQIPTGAAPKPSNGSAPGATDVPAPSSTEPGPAQIPTR